jgi:hypothetical protein
MSWYFLFIISVCHTVVQMCVATELRSDEKHLVILFLDRLSEVVL